MPHALLKRATKENAPIVDGDQATFLWRGKRPVQLMGDWNNWDVPSALTLTQVEPDLWMHTLTLPRDTYMEYTYVRNGKRLLDPLNPRTTPNGMGDANNFFYMPDASPTSLARRKRSIVRGQVTRHIIEAAWFVVGGKRIVYLYQPPTQAPCPLMVVYDGLDYLRRARLPIILDNLIAQERIRPVALAMVANGGKARMIEYACSETTLGFVMEKVLPLAQQNLNLTDLRESPGTYGVLGASMGGLMSLYTALRVPQVFGHVISQSGAFASDEHEWVATELVRHAPTRPIEIWMDAGRFEWLLGANQNMHALLRDKGYDVTYHEFSGGHNYPAWRDDVWRGLETVFGKA